MSERDMVTAGELPVWGLTWIALRERFDCQAGLQFVFGPHASEHGIANNGEVQQVAVEFAPESEALVIIPADEVDDSFEMYPLRSTNIGGTYPPNHELTLPPGLCETLNLDYQSYDESDPFIFQISEVEDRLLPLWPEGPQSAVLENGQLLDPDDYDFDAAREHDSITETALSQRTLGSVAVSDDVGIDELTRASVTLRDEVETGVPESQDPFEPVETGSKRIRFLPPGTWRSYSDEYPELAEAVALAHRREAEQITSGLEETGDWFKAGVDVLISHN
jgi:hypothetical protein